MENYKQDQVSVLMYVLKQPIKKCIWFRHELFKQTILHVKQLNVVEKTKQLGDNADWNLSIYPNAAHGDCDKGTSQQGCLIFVVGKHSKCNLFKWQSKW